MHGLKQSPRCWNSALDSHLKEMGFVQVGGDPCLYIASEGEMFLIADKQSAISMLRNPQFHGRSKHIGIKYHFIREQVTSGKVELKYCRTSDMVADIMTKKLNGEQFEKLRLMAGVAPMIKQTS